MTGESTKNKVENISFSGIVFAHTNFLRPSREGLLNLQAGQFAVKVEDRGYLKSNEFMLWHPEAGIEVTNASRVVFEDNIFTQMAATGLDFTSGTNDTRIEGNVFTEIGGSSISIGKFAPDSLTEIHKGYNPSDRDEICTHDTVKNNYVHNTTNEIQGAVPILGGYPRYVVIEHNEVSYANYSGISVGFGWTKKETAMDGNKINYNEIHHIARLLCDGAAIYTLSNQGKNGQIMYNYSHDINGSDWADYWTCPIYQDEGTSGFEIAYNVAVNAPKGTACNQCGSNYTHDNDGSDKGVINNAGIEQKYKSIKNKDIPLPNFSEAIPQEPYSSVFTLPGKIEMEDYDLGGQGIAYYDKDVENQGEAYRNDGVDIVTVDSISDAKGYAIGYTQEGEWTEYSIAVEKTAPYFYKANVASGLDFSSFIIMVDGKQVADTVKIPQTDNWNTYTTVDGKTSEIEAGDHILRVRISGAYANIDWIAFAETKEELEELTNSLDIISREPMEATVVDMMGKTLAKIVAKSSVDATMKIREKRLPSGVYAVRFSNGKTQLIIMK